MYMCIYIYICVYIYIYLYTCVYISVYVHIYVICIFTYIYTCFAHVAFNKYGPLVKAAASIQKQNSLRNLQAYWYDHKPLASQPLDNGIN